MPRKPDRRRPRRITALETRYEGHRFRSRLEARWAVFFDALGVRYHYEPQGYGLGGGLGSYLPDFWIPPQSGFRGGYVEIKGRKKDIIIRGGENISVKEVEDLLYRHPKISEVAIVAMPDSEMGEKACTYLVPEEGETPTLDEINQFLAEEGVAKQKLPERLEIVDQMPMTASGKIQKYLLKEDVERKLEA